MGPGAQVGGNPVGMAAPWLLGPWNPILSSDRFTRGLWAPPGLAEAPRAPADYRPHHPEGRRNWLHWTCEGEVPGAPTEWMGSAQAQIACRPWKEKGLCKEGTPWA